MKGQGISEGLAIGRAWIVNRGLPEFSDWPPEPPTLAADRFRDLRDRLAARLAQAGEQAAQRGDGTRSEILEAHRMMLGDPELEAAVHEALKQGTPLPAAIGTALQGFIDLMEALADPYLKGRAADYRDLSHQLLWALAGREGHQGPEPGQDWIAVAEDFAPSDISLAESGAVLGFLSQGGAPATHFSILARIAGLPVVIRVPEALKQIAQGDLLVLDGTAGTVVINPDPETLSTAKAEQEAALQAARQLEGLRKERTRTLDGVEYHLEGNIAGPQDVARLVDHGAEGIGLFRTEFIYMDRATAPTEAEQAEIYRQVLAAASPLPVVIRTLDVGGDKELPYLGIPKEENPFLGFRAVRCCLARPELFRTQLRALLRASVAGNLQIMVPMISGLEEVRQVKALLAQCREELLAERVPVADSVKLGIMVEVPAAAAMAPLLAEEADFFSIGTNDLIQYMMAADRMNPQVAYLYTPYHPAFLRTLQAVIDGAHGGGIPAAMCGELAGDTAFIPVLVGLGLDRFSMNAGALLKARRRIRTLRASDCRGLVAHLMTLRTEAEIRGAVAAFGQEHGHETA